MLTEEQKKQLLKGPTVMRGISLPKGLNDALRERSQQEDRPASRIIRRALLFYFGLDEEGEFDE